MSNPHNILTDTEVARLNQLEAVVQRGIGGHVEVGNAFAEIRERSLYRGTDQTFDTYLRDRWGIRYAHSYRSVEAEPAADSPSIGQNVPAATTDAQARAVAPVRHEGPQPPAGMGHAAPQEFSSGDVTVVDIRLTVSARGVLVDLKPGPAAHRSPSAESEASHLLRRLRARLTHSAGTIAYVAHQLETSAAQLDENAREQLWDDVVALGDELATLKTLLIAPVNWDADLDRLLAGEIPPCEDDADDEEDC